LPQKADMLWSVRDKKGFFQVPERRGEPSLLKLREKKSLPQVWRWIGGGALALSPKKKGFLSPFKEKNITNQKRGSSAPFEEGITS